MFDRAAAVEDHELGIAVADRKHQIPPRLVARCRALRRKRIYQRGRSQAAPSRSVGQPPCALVGLQRGPDMLHAKLNQLVSLTCPQGVEHLTMLAPGAHQQHRIADSVTADAEGLDPNALDHSGEVAIVARRKHGVVELVVECANALELVTIHGLAILIVDRFESFDQGPVGRQRDTADGLGLKQGRESVGC